MNDDLKLIPIKHLFNKHFFIPAYQRGYRWNKRQVIDLLEDILEFQKKDKEKGEFYCLQPIVVTKKENNDWEVIDGQQRLTTLHILLSYLKEARDIMFSSTEMFSISYETRAGSKDFLENILEKEEINDRNADYFHISKAYLAIQEWFEGDINKADFLNALLKVDYLEDTDKDVANNVRFIWYEVQTESEKESASIFARINMGKIPLTNAELIKALFFISDGDTDKEKDDHKQALAYEWENIENSLQNNNFWFFINKDKNPMPTRIEFIFDLIANEPKKTDDEYFTFISFNDLINDETKTKDELWEETKTYFRTFDEWYDNNEYYHLIGYLVHIGNGIKEAKDIYHQSKLEFKKKLKESIRNDIKNEFDKKQTKNIDELSYDDDEDLIRKILLLFNVISTMNSEYTKFPFERYINEKWSLEHIHAQNSQDLNDRQKRKVLEDQMSYFEGYKNSNAEIIKDFLNLDWDNVEANRFDKIQEQLFPEYAAERESENIHSIDNMALLSTNNNTALSNNVFPIKRNKIIELDKKGSFIPICTKNAFLKYYSTEDIQNSKWAEKDRKSYLESIKIELEDFLSVDEITNGKYN